MSQRSRFLGRSNRNNRRSSSYDLAAGGWFSAEFAATAGLFDKDLIAPASGPAVSSSLADSSATAEALTGLFRVNAASQANSGVASASSQHVSGGYPAASANNGARTTAGWGSGSGGWNDNTANAFPDTLEIAFNGSYAISEINVFTVPDNVPSAAQPTLSDTFTLYGATAYQVQTWDGAAWVDVPGGNITGNNNVWRQFTFAAITTTKIRIVVNDSADHQYSRLAEVEAWGTPAAAGASGSLSDPAGTGEALTATGANNAALPDAATTGEALAGVAANGAVLADTASTGETVSAGGSINAALIDSAGTGETLNASSANTVSLADNTVSGESLSATAQAVGVLVDPTATGDSLNGSSTSTATLADSATTSEDLAGSFAGVGSAEIVDSAASGETLTAAYSAAGAINDGAGTGDSYGGSSSTPQPSALEGGGGGPFARWVRPARLAPAVSKAAKQARKAVKQAIRRQPQREEPRPAWRLTPPVIAALTEAAQAQWRLQQADAFAAWQEAERLRAERFAAFDALAEQVRQQLELEARAQAEVAALVAMLIEREARDAEDLAALEALLLEPEAEAVGDEILALMLAL